MLHINNEQALTSIFGRWPSFHDAEILSLLLERSGEDGPSLTATIHLWQMTSAVDDRGYYVLENHTLATLRFGGILLESLSGFNHQNVLSELEISAIDPSLQENEGRRCEVGMPTVHGCEAWLKCRSVTVVSAVPAQSP